MTGDVGNRGSALPPDPRFDMQAALARLGGDQSLFDELVVLFHSDAPKMLVEIRAGLAGAEARRVERGAHTLKAMAATFDATGVVATARRIEQLAKAGDLPAAADSLESLTAELAALRAALPAPGK
jgi:HPt (histidine-containing phosphotransfer) domain-containing protein